jgi:hypothetical protein
MHIYLLGPKYNKCQRRLHFCRNQEYLWKFGPNALNLNGRWAFIRVQRHWRWIAHEGAENWRFPDRAKLGVDEERVPSYGERLRGNDGLLEQLEYEKFRENDEIYNPFDVRTKLKPWSSNGPVHIGLEQPAHFQLHRIRWFFACGNSFHLDPICVKLIAKDLAN